MIQTHSLKLNTDYFDAVASGTKNFEVRRDDRGFQKGDRLRLLRYGTSWISPRRPDYLQGKSRVTKSDADTIERVITYVLTGGQHGIEPGYVVLGLAEVEDA